MFQVSAPESDSKQVEKLVEKVVKYKTVVFLLHVITVDGVIESGRYIFFTTTE